MNVFLVLDRIGYYRMGKCDVRLSASTLLAVWSKIKFDVLL